MESLPSLSSLRADHSSLTHPLVSITPRWMMKPINSNLGRLCRRRHSAVMFATLLIATSTRDEIDVYAQLKVSELFRGLVYKRQKKNHPLPNYFKVSALSHSILGRLRLRSFHGSKLRVYGNVANILSCQGLLPAARCQGFLFLKPEGISNFCEPNFAENWRIIVAIGSPFLWKSYFLESKDSGKI